MRLVTSCVRAAVSSRFTAGGGGSPRAWAAFGTPARARWCPLGIARRLSAQRRGPGAFGEHRSGSDNVAPWRRSVV